MDAEIIAVGTELLMGELVDSNSAFLPKETPGLITSAELFRGLGIPLDLFIPPKY